MLSEKKFWWYWLGGIGLLVLMALKNPALATAVAPGGILDHQAASNAAMVDAIQQAWANAGTLLLARVSMAIDLVFIGIYTRGALGGGLIFRNHGSALVSRLGTLIAIAAVIFCLADYSETISEFIEILTFKGSDVLSAIHSTAQPIKSVAFIVTLVGLLTALVLRRMTAKPG